MTCRPLCRALAAAALALGGAAGTAQAMVLWDGDAAKGIGVFNGVECAHGTVTTTKDPRYGTVWKFFFPDGDDRCEVRGSRGYDITEGTEIYVGWRVRYDVAPGTLRYVFQMKGYPPPALQSNHPIVFGTQENLLVLINYDLQDQRHTIWQTAITRDQWMSIVLRMKISKDPSAGFVELWFDGQKQKFVNGQERIPANTFDAGRTQVKWGIYRGGQGPGDCYQYLAAPRIGTSYEDVAPAALGGSATDASTGALPDADSSGPAEGGASDAAPAVDAPAVLDGARAPADAAGGRGGTPGASGGTGGGGAGGASDEPGTGGEARPASAGGGCTCRLAEGPAGGFPAGVALALVLMLVVARAGRTK
jgi:hypothetical protein